MNDNLREAVRWRIECSKPQGDGTTTVNVEEVGSWRDCWDAFYMRVYSEVEPCYYTMINSETGEKFCDLKVNL